MKKDLFDPDNIEDENPLFNLDSIEAEMPILKKQYFNIITELITNVRIAARENCFSTDTMSCVRALDVMHKLIKDDIVISDAAQYFQELEDAEIKELEKEQETI